MKKSKKLLAVIAVVVALSLGATLFFLQAGAYDATPTVAGGSTFYVVLAADGTVWAWDTSAGGPFGFTVPTQLSGLTDIKEISAGLNHFLALDKDGNVYSMGDNTYGQLGMGAGPANWTTPTEITSLSNVTAIAAGGYHNLVIQGGAVQSWGLNADGQLGTGNITSRNTPGPTAGGNLTSGVTQIGAGINHSIALKNGVMWAWGDNRQKQIGTGTGTNPITTPDNTEKGLTNNNITAIGAGLLHTVALRNGVVWITGDDTSNQLGGANTTGNSFGTVLGLPNNIVDIAVGSNYTVALDADGNVYAWGGPYGQKNGTKSPPIATGAESIFIGSNGVVTMDTDGNIFVDDGNGPTQLPFNAKDAHVHTWSWTSDADHHWQVCTDCGTTSVVQEHNWGAWTIVVPATKDAAGMSMRLCPTCGADDYDDNVPFDCPHDGDTYAIETLAPTCTATGLKDVYCTECDEKIAEDVEVAINPANHAGYGTYDVVTLAATCADTGLKNVCCEGCDIALQTDVEVAINPANHTGYGTYDVVTLAATCADTGLKNVCCEGCDVALQTDVEVAINPANHAGYGTYDVVTLAATCTVAGSKDICCAGCDEVLDTVAIPATGHDWGDWEPYGEGIEKRVCNTCGKDELRIVGNPNPGGTECPRCGQVHTSILDRIFCFILTLIRMILNFFLKLLGLPLLAA